MYFCKVVCSNFHGSECRDRPGSELGYRVQHVRNAEDRGELQNDDPKGVIYYYYLTVDCLGIYFPSLGEFGASEISLIRPMESRSCQFSKSPVRITGMKPAKNFSEGLVLDQ